MRHIGNMTQNNQNKTLSGNKVAMLAANGFDQHDMIESQKALIAAGANVRIVSSDNGLVNGWEGKAWGHHFAVDSPLASALAADYDMLVIPAGNRSFDKLKLTAHTKRFINGFMAANKPVAVFGDALNLLFFSDHIRGRTVNGADTMKDMIAQAGGTWSDSTPCIDGNLMTGVVDTAEGRTAFVVALLEHFANAAPLAQAA
jgi:protease I